MRSKKKKKKMKKRCERCGEPIEGNGIQGYCSACYEKIWDRGFESTTQHAEEIAEAQEKRRKKGDKSNPSTPPK